MALALQLWELFCKLFLGLIVPTALIATLALLVIILSLTFSQNATLPKVRPRGTPVHLLVMLGSGGHTAEMFYMLDNMPLDPTVYTHRTYVVSSGDDLSAVKAVEFETNTAERLGILDESGTYDIVTIPRARRVHQSYWTAPFSVIHCFYACILVLCGRFPGQRKLPSKYSSSHPDVILTNGPAVAVCMIFAAKVIRFFVFLYHWISTRGTKPAIPRLRTIFVESWARITTLSTSGVLLLPLADRFLVQWPKLAGRRAWWGMKETEYAGWVVV